MGMKSTASISEPGRFRQTLAALVVNIGGLMYGTNVGWSSPMTPILQSNDSSPVGRRISDEEASWLTGVLCLGAILTLPLYSPIAEKFGRRITGCFTAVPIGLCWLLTIIATDLTYLYVARFFAGVGGAGCMFIVPLYVSEISADSIRGQLGSFMVFAINIGIVLAYVAGSIMSYKMCAICGLAISILFLASFSFMPETPNYLVRRNRIDDAARSLWWLKKGDKAAVDRELVRLQLLMADDEVEDHGGRSRSVGLKDLARDRGTRRALVLALGLFSGQQLCGIFAMISYAGRIFEMAGSGVSPDMAAIIIGMIQVFGSWLSTVLMERAGRRVLIGISYLGMGMCHLAIGTFSKIQSEPDYDVDGWRWVPLAALSIYAIAYNVGMGSGPFIVASEIFPSDIRSLANSLAHFVMWLFAFILVKFFPTMINAIGVSGSFFFLGLCCFLNFIFIYFLLPETKGRTIESIIDQLNNPHQHHHPAPNKSSNKKKYFREITSAVSS